MFYAGQKVLCVNDEPLVPGLHMDGLQKGRIYTIREAGIELRCSCVRLEEIIRHLGLNTFLGQELPFAAYRFRPVTERKTSIAVFEEILKRAPNEMERA